MSLFVVGTTFMEGLRIWSNIHVHSRKIRVYCIEILVYWSEVLVHWSRDN